MVIGYKYLSHDFEHSITSNENFSDDKDIILIELITDFNDSTSVTLSNHIKKIADYTKLPIKEIDIEQWNSPSYKIGTKTKVLVIKNTLELRDETLNMLLTFVSQGGLLFTPNFVHDKRMDYFYGLVKNGPRERVFEPMGYFFDTDFLPNIKGTTYGKHIYHGGLNKTSFKDDVSILATAINDRNYPTIIENKVGLGSVILFNTSNNLRKQERGVLFSALIKGLEGIPYPIANVSTIFLDDFPSPLYDVKEEPIKSEMDLTILDFVKDVWWPDMLKLSDTFNIKYTALPAFDYRNFNKPPFLFDQWDTHTLTEKKNKIFVSDWMSIDVLEHGHELGLHGYNHISLLIDDWELADYMTIALKSAKKKWTISGFGQFPVSYVPPSNYIDSIGMSKLGIAFPEIKYMASLYLGSYYEGGNREFDQEKWNSQFFNYPRITSGYQLNEQQKFIQQSLFLYSGIWTHFVHPDDVYQIPSDDTSSAGHFALRNKNSLGWRKSKDGSKGLLGVFADYLHEIEEIYPLSRYVSAEEGATVTKDWRVSKYSFAKKGEEYGVERMDNNDKGEYYWFLYASHKNVPTIEAELSIKAEKFEKTPILNGYLYSIKTTHPSLSIISENLNSMLTRTVASKVLEDFTLYNIPLEGIHNIVNKALKPTKNSSLKQWTSYYVENENLSDASALLKQKIDSEHRIDTSMFNEYFKFMIWQDKPKEAWAVLQNHINKYPLDENIKYSRYLGVKNGYPNDTIRKSLLKQQFNVFNDKEILYDYYNTFNTVENYKEITKILERLLKADPNLKNEKTYLQHLIAYEPKRALTKLNKYIPRETSSLWSIAEEISWFYANNKRYKKAYDWSKQTNKIPIITKLYWLAEIKDYESLRKEYIHYVANNPNDSKTLGEISQILLSHGKHVESWGLVSALPETQQKDTLKRVINKDVIYLKKVTQKDLINRYANLFESNIKKNIIKDIRLTENNFIKAETVLIGSNNNAASFEKSISYGIKTAKLNIHIISVTNNDLFDLRQVSTADEDNIKKNVYGLEYKYSNKPNEKLNYYARGRIEKDKQDNLYYQVGVGVSLPKNNSFTSFSINTNPVKTGPGYKKRIYQTKAAVYQESIIKNTFKTIVYAEGNHYSNNDLEGKVTTKLVLESNKDKMFKVLPQVEVSFTKSNANNIKDYPYYLVEERFFAGGGVGLKYGNEKSKLNVRVEGSTFVDNDLGDFNRFIGQASLNVGNFTKISVSGELSTQSKSYSNSLQIGLKHTF